MHEVGQDQGVFRKFRELMGGKVLHQILHQTPKELYKTGLFCGNRGTRKTPRNTGIPGFFQPFDPLCS